MRIAFYATTPDYLELGFSGDHVFVKSLLEHLSARGHQVRVISRFSGADLYHGRISTRRLVTEAITVRREMQRFSPDAWLVYGPSCKRPDLFGWWQRPQRYVLLAADSGNAGHLPSMWRRLFEAAHRHSMARADKVTVWRARAADRLRVLGVAEDRVSVLLPAGRTWDSLPSRTAARQSLGLPAETPVILSVSRLPVLVDGKPEKTQMILKLLAAVASLPSEVILVLVGDGPGRQRVEEVAAELKPPGRVRMFGAVEDLRLFYAACDMFAFPDLDDRPRLAILEAQGCGRPVVTMHTASAELIVDAGRTGLLAKDLEEFQAHMAALASDLPRCQSMGQAAREYIENFHSMEIRVRQIEDMLGGHN